MLDEIGRAITLLNKAKKKFDDLDSFVVPILEAIERLAEASLGEDDDEDKIASLTGAYDICGPCDDILLSSLETAKKASLELLKRHDARKKLLGFISELSRLSTNNMFFLSGKLSPRFGAVDVPDLEKVIGGLKLLKDNLNSVNKRRSKRVSKR